MSDTNVSRAVAEVVRQSGQTLWGFAQTLGVSPSYLSDLSRGNRSLSAAMAARLSKHKPKRSVRDWMVLQLDDGIDRLNRRRAVLRNAPNV